MLSHILIMVTSPCSAHALAQACPTMSYILQSNSTNLPPRSRAIASTSSKVRNSTSYRSYRTSNEKHFCFLCTNYDDHSNYCLTLGRHMYAHVSVHQYAHSSSIGSSQIWTLKSEFSGYLEEHNVILLQLVIMFDLHGNGLVRVNVP